MDAFCVPFKILWESFIKTALLIRNIGSCLTLDSDSAADPLGTISNAAIATDQEKILWVGPEADLPKDYRDAETLDAGGALVTPGLVDCHTHLMFAGNRSDEFFARLQGTSYEEIAKRGGGIQKTVAATRAASDEELMTGARKRLDRFLHFGVTTVEIKSGYGLSVDEEIRLLRLIKNLEHTVDVVPTFLGAHVVPAEFAKEREEYVRLVCEEMLPRVKKEQLSNICDVFCDKGAFSANETKAILSQARKLGMNVKLHADQLCGTGGAELATEFKALSADHLEHVSDAGISALAKAGVVAVLLPGAVFSLGKRTYPPARKLMEAGVTVALSTDCNPGTSYSENLPLMMSFAAVELRMTCEEIWPAVTKNAAKALGLADRGSMRPGLRADLAIWDASDPRDLPYRYGAAFPSKVVKNGRLTLDIPGVSH